LINIDLSSGVASASLRCLAIAAECLTNRREQEEALEIFSRIKREGGWRIQFVIDELHEKWGWTQQDTDMGNTTNNPSSFYQQGTGQATMPPLPQPPPPQASRKPPSGIVNPLYKNADFSKPDAPYKNFYVPPALPPPPPSLQQQQQNQSQLQHHPSGSHGMHTGNGYGFSGLAGM
jgi:hypothetical protein